MANFFKLFAIELDLACAYMSDFTLPNNDLDKYNVTYQISEDAAQAVSSGAPAIIRIVGPKAELEKVVRDWYEPEDAEMQADFIEQIQEI